MRMLIQRHVFSAHKDMVYSVAMTSRDQLIQRITEACEEIKTKPVIIHKAVGHLRIRSRKCLEERGGIFEHKLRTL
jgi:L-lactate utilization protein LutC